MSQNVKEISGKELEELISSGKTVVCDFWATWCGPCRMLAPVVDEVAGELLDKAVFVKVDVDENEDAARKYGVMSIPTVYLFAEGKIKTHTVGFLPKPQFKAWVEQNI